jgi:hypothetical protein
VSEKETKGPADVGCIMLVIGLMTLPAGKQMPEAGSQPTDASSSFADVVVLPVLGQGDQQFRSCFRGADQQAAVGPVEKDGLDRDRESG